MNTRHLEGLRARASWNCLFCVLLWIILHVLRRGTSMKYQLLFCRMMPAAYLITALLVTR